MRSRASPGPARSSSGCSELDDDEVAATLAEVVASFAGRHADLGATLDEHFELVSHRIEHPAELSTADARLVGAYFTQEYAVESAALCNPSIVPHPDQRGLGPGDARFVMSLRAVGEGHRSSIEFRTGVIAAGSELRFDVPGRTCSPDARVRRRLPAGSVPPGAEIARRRRHERGVRARLAARPVHAATSSSGALGALHDQLRHPPRRDRDDRSHPMDRRLQLRGRPSRPPRPSPSGSSRRTAPIESHGMEDARFVRFVDDDGIATYYAHLHRVRRRPTSHRSSWPPTTSGRSPARSSPGAVPRNKGMALFPRRIGGRYVALSRWDRETNAIATSDDPPSGTTRSACNARPSPGSSSSSATADRRSRRRPAGSCSPTASDRCAGTPSGPLLLDLDDPTRVIGHLTEPLLTPAETSATATSRTSSTRAARCSTATPSCSPTASSDANVGIATIPLGQLLDRLTTAAAH